MKVFKFNFLFLCVLFASASAIADNVSIKVACRDAACPGGVCNANPSEVCVNALPVCDEVWLGSADPKTGDHINGVKENVVSFLSWKIYGFYFGKDIDPNKNTLPKSGRVTADMLEGKPTKVTMCSVVGQTLANSSGQVAADAEITSQKIGLKSESCGTLPKFVKTDEAYGFKLVFDETHGDRWSSYLQGAYPWVYRKAASDVLKAFDIKKVGNPSEYEKVFVEAKNNSMVHALEVQLQNNKNAYSKMSAAEKAICSPPPSNAASPAPLSKDVCANMSPMDPAYVVCSLNAARASLSTGFLPQLILYEIDLRAKKLYKEKFANLLIESESDGKKDFKIFLDACRNDFHKVNTYKFGRYACTASCVLGGEDYHVRKTNEGYEPETGACDNVNDGITGGCNDCKMASRPYLFEENVMQKGKVRYGGTIQNGSEYMTRTWDGDSTAINNKVVTLASGFAGVVEKKIRLMCGQSKTSAGNDCDDVRIPSIPRGIQD